MTAPPPETEHARTRGPKALLGPTGIDCVAATNECGCSGR
jgi:hypothetical protein